MKRRFGITEFVFWFNIGGIDKAHVERAMKLAAEKVMPTFWSLVGRKRRDCSSGYVGLGNMGAALARRLLRKDKMRVYDLRPETMARLADLGGIACQNPKALAAQSDLVMTLPADLQGGAAGHLRQRRPGLGPEEGRRYCRHDDGRSQRHPRDG